MRRFSPSHRPIAALLRPSSSYTCSACRRAFASSPISADSSSRTDKIRQRLWGTSQPPGLKDPYGDASVLGQAAEASKAEETEVVAKPRRKKEVSDPNYVPADTADGLEWVGGYGGWWKNNWDPKHQFAGFLAGHRVADGYEATALLRRALVEVVALQTAGRGGDASRIEGRDRTGDVQLVAGASGPEVRFAAGQTLEAFVQALETRDETAVKENPTESEEGVAADRSDVDPLAETESPVEETAVKENPTEAEEDVAADRSDADPLAEHQSADYRALVESWDPSWLQTALTPSIKFAVLKRTMQLTGVRISDADIAHISTAQDLLARLITPPKARKATEALAQSDAFDELPNVRIYDRRVTPIDQEKQVGRWKVIEEELVRRGLPVTGRGS